MLSRPTSRKCNLLRGIVPLLVAAAILAIALPVSAREVDWYTSFEDALEAARESRKPILVFVYLGTETDDYEGVQERITLPGSRAARERQAVDHRRMIDTTLKSPGVQEAARAFEPVMLDIRLKDNDEARQRLKVSPVVRTNDEQQERVGVYPITLFLDANGDELFRRHGYLPPEAYELQLVRATNLFEKLREVVEDPEDPVLLRNLGRAYMEMDFSRGDRFYRAAIRNLEKAIQRDPDNATGANFDARVDLAILRLPDNPRGALDTLGRLAEEEEGERSLEIQYYRAVAHYVSEDHDAASRILSDFETDDRNSPYFDSEWTPQALGLLQHIRAKAD